MKLEFESIEEVKEFVTKLKGTRGGKADKDEAETTQGAPEPLKPPAGGQTAAFNPGNAATGFVPPAGGATAAAGGPFAAAAPAGPAPEVQALVNRIVPRIDGAIAGGQPADAVLSWFRGQCGAEAANFSMDQIKTVALLKMTVPQLEGIAKLMNA